MAARAHTATPARTVTPAHIVTHILHSDPSPHSDPSLHSDPSPQSGLLAPAGPYCGHSHISEHHRQPQGGHRRAWTGRWRLNQAEATTCYLGSLCGHALAPWGTAMQCGPAAASLSGPQGHVAKNERLDQSVFFCASVENCAALPGIPMVPIPQALLIEHLLCAGDRRTARPPKGPGKTTVEAGGGAGGCEAWPCAGHTMHPDQRALAPPSQLRVRWVPASSLLHRCQAQWPQEAK